MVKLFIESRYRTSGSAEDFVYQLPRGIDLPHSTAWVDDVVIPNVFYGVRAGYNDRLYLREGLAPPFVYRVLALTPGQYNALTLVPELEAQMNAGPQGAVYTASWNERTGKLEIETTGVAFAFFGESLLPSSWNAEAPLALLISGSPNSANKTLGFYSEDLVLGAPTAPLVAPDTVDMTSHRVLYVHGDLGTPDQAFGPRGDSGVLRKVLIDAPQNALIVDRHTTTWGGIEVDAQPLRSMRFSLRDSAGQVVDLQGHEWSFSVYFVERL